MDVIFVKTKHFKLHSIPGLLFIFMQEGMSAEIQNANAKKFSLEKTRKIQQLRTHSKSNEISQLIHLLAG